MKQQYNLYTSEDHSIWQTLFKRQLDTLPGRACQAYLDCLEELRPVLNEHSIPRFSEVNEVLLAKNGWQIVVVPGLIEVEDFFQLLSERKFPASTWLRSRAQLDYLEEPDMFHDVFGHIPLLMNADYARFMETFGTIGVAAIGDKERIKELQRLYWFTIEFGLLRNSTGDFRIYGAGILSSHEETKHIFDRAVQVHPFALPQVIATEYDLSAIQVAYFAVSGFEELYTKVLEAELVSV